MTGVDERDRFDQPGALLPGEVGAEGEEIALVATAEGRARSIAPRRRMGLVEEDDFRDHRGQSPGGLLNAVAQRKRDAGLAAEDPVAARALVEIELEVEAVGSVSVDVGGEIELASLPELTTVVRDIVIVADQTPAGEMVEEGALVVLIDDDIDVTVIARLVAEPGVDGPAAAEGPRWTEGGHEAGDAGEGFRDGGDRLHERCGLVAPRRVDYVP